MGNKHPKYIMKYVQLCVIALICVAVACTKKKDDNPVPEVEPPVTNNPDPNKPVDSTNTPPKVIPEFGDFSPANCSRCLLQSFYRL